MHAARLAAGVARTLAVVLAVGTLLPYPTAVAQAPAITAADLRQRLFLLAADSMDGRATGSPEHLVATAYIAGELERLGLEPAGDRGTFFQDLPLVSRGFVAGGTITVGGRRFVLGEDFGATVTRGGVVALPASAQVIDGGEAGAQATYPPRERAEGRIVLLRPSSRSISFGIRSMQVDDDSHFAGAAAVILPVWDRVTSSQRRQLLGTSLSLRRNTIQLPPTFVVSREMFEALRAQGDRAVAVDVAFAERPAPARNVVAVLRGRDAALRAEYVALGAHSDHEGGISRAVDHDSLRAALALRRARGSDRRERVHVNVDSLRAIRPARQDSIRNGADDDGSGTVALLEIAEALASARERPRRSVLFVFHAAEELGLLGSGWFTDHPTLPREAIVAQLNLDMVGRGGAGDIRGGGPRYLQLIGARRLSDDLGDAIDRANKSRREPFLLDRSLDATGHRDNLYCRSDHAQYARYGIPVAFFSTGLHADYHQVTDEPQYIDYAKLESVSELVKDVTLALAERETRPLLSKPRPDPTARCRQ